MPSNKLLKDLALAFKRGGIEYAHNFPGFHSHELFAYLDGGVTSTNEKIAYELAWGSSQAGSRSLVTFKNVGLNDAADPFINSHLNGVSAGSVLVVFDDIELEGSQCILDSRHYASFYGGLWLEPYSYDSALILAEAAPTLSNIFDIPVILRLTNVSTGFKPGEKLNYSPADLCEIATSCMVGTDISIEPVVHPMNGNAQRTMVSTKNSKIQEFVNTLHARVNPASPYERITVGNAYSEADSAIVTLPVPDINQTSTTSVIEVGDSVVSNALRLKATQAKFEAKTIGYNQMNTENYIRTARYERLFRLLKPEYQYIAGDLGEYTKDTLDTLTHCLCFGSSLSVASGMTIAGARALAITGDASYYHSAKNVWQEARDRGLSPKLVLLDNGGSQGTGGQPIPGAIEETIDVLSVDYDLISDEELAIIVKHFIISTGPMLLKVNHKV